MVKPAFIFQRDRGTISSAVGTAFAAALLLYKCLQIRIISKTLVASGLAFMTEGMPLHVMDIDARLNNSRNIEATQEERNLLKFNADVYGVIYKLAKNYERQVKILISTIAIICFSSLYFRSHPIKLLCTLATAVVFAGNAETSLKLLQELEAELPFRKALHGNEENCKTR